MTDWEADPRMLGECLKAWARAHEWTRDEAAAELRAQRSTYDGWCDGRSSAAEPSLRRLMTLIDLTQPPASAEAPRAGTGAAMQRVSR